MVIQQDVFAKSSRRSFFKVGSFAAIGAAINLSGVPEALGETAASTDRRHAIASDRKNGAQPPSPPWTKNLIIYEIATKGFTSPNGPASGTFNSLRARLAYLQELGITGVWLSGYSWCDPTHFYNIWNQYAVIQPDKLDPSLGTESDFKAMISEAHDRGIKVFLDVITHGVMDYSPLVKAHPEWFRGTIWDMREYDWNGGHPDLEGWWVKMYTDYVTKYGVDGYRLDWDIIRPDLWERIRQNVTAAGHPIAIWEEGNSVIPGVTDFTQRENPISSTRNGTLNQFLESDMAGFYDRKFGRTGYYEVEVVYTDGTKSVGSTQNDGQLGVKLVGLTADKVSRRRGDVLPNLTPGLKQLSDGLLDVQLTVENTSHKPISNIVVRNDMDERWALESKEWHTRPAFVDSPESYEPLVVGTKVDIFVGTLAWGSTVQLSCHDNGWEGSTGGPYVARGSRSLFGYSFLLSPMIPIFFSGEEFNATFHAQPGLSPNEYSDKLAGKGRPFSDADAGKGHWLYGTMIDWNELRGTTHWDMFKDVQKLIAIRKQHSDVLAICPGGEEPNLRAIDHQGDIDVPVPYLRWAENAAILVVGNRNNQKDAHLKLAIDLKAIGLGDHGSYRVLDLWSGGAAKTLSEAELRNFTCTVNRDNSPGGGISIFRIELVK